MNLTNIVQRLTDRKTKINMAAQAKGATGALGRSVETAVLAGGVDGWRVLAWSSPVVGGMFAHASLLEARSS